MDTFWLSFWLSVFGIGLGVIAQVFGMTPVVKKVLGGVGISLVVIGGIGIFASLGVWPRSPFSSQCEQPPLDMEVLFMYGIFESENCGGKIRTAQLLDCREKYKVALSCGPIDPSIDEVNDTRISISSTFTITGQDIPIRMPSPQEIKNQLGKGEGAAWFRAVLVPKDVDTVDIHRLSDVLRFGGKILSKRYFEFKIPSNE